MSKNEKTVYTLLPYQKAFLADKSRFKLGNWSRQTGKSFSTALEAVLDCVEHPGTLWVCLSAGERQSKEWMEKARRHTEVVKMVCEFSGSQFDAETAQLTIKMANGSRIIGLPANPNTARGYSANVILDEFAFHEDSREIWKALVPAITRGYRLIVMSTPNGLGNQFAELCTGKAGANFSKHVVTLPQAKEDGLDVNLDELRSAVDEDTWQQEYLCQFVDSASAFLPYELISPCELPVGRGLDDGINGDAPFFVGVDVGRKHDLTVIWVAQREGARLTTRRVIELRGMPFSQQETILWGLLQHVNLGRCCMDASGLGMQLAERAQDRFGRYRVEPVQFSGPVKAALAYPMRAAFEDRTVAIPSAGAIREDLHKIKKTTTAAGNIRFEAESDDAGHADRFWALALCIHAAQGDSGPVRMEAWDSVTSTEYDTPNHDDDKY